MVNLRHLISLASRTHGHLSFGTFGDEKVPLVEFRGSSLAAIKRNNDSCIPQQDVFSSHLGPNPSTLVKILSQRLTCLSNNAFLSTAHTVKNNSYLHSFCSAPWISFINRRRSAYCIILSFYPVVSIIQH
jgi:hypothetical protein